MYGQGALSKPSTRTGNKKLAKLMKALDDDNDSDDASLPTPAATPAPGDTATPWLQEFNAYINSAEESLGDMSLPEWWGVRRHSDWLHSYYLLLPKG